jgi:hypothetical protein
MTFERTSTLILDSPIITTVNGQLTFTLPSSPGNEAPALVVEGGSVLIASRREETKARPDGSP